MKRRLNNLKNIFKIIHEDNGWSILMLILQILILAIHPLASLLLSAQVINMLTEAIAIASYLQQLLVWLIGIFLLQLAKIHLEKFFNIQKEALRMRAVEKIGNSFLERDYPLILGKESQDTYNKAQSLTYNPQTFFGRILDDLSQFGSATLALIIYASLLLQVESLLLVFILITIMILTVFKVLLKRWEVRMKEALSQNSQQNSYLRRTFGDTRVAKDVRLYQMHGWLNQIQDKIMKDKRALNQDKVRLLQGQNVLISLSIAGLSFVAYSQSIQQVASGLMTVAEFVVYVGTITLIVGVMNQFVEAIAKMDLNIQEVEYYTTYMETDHVLNHGQGHPLPQEDFYKGAVAFCLRR